MNNCEEEELMEDKLNPTSQFHPYQPLDTSVVRGGMHGGLGGILRKSGIERQVSRARDLARSHPGALLGSLAALAIGAGLLRVRS
jgi:hypothetical protein